MRFTKILAAALLVGSSAFALPGPAVSAPLISQPNLASAVPSATENVRFRGHGFRRGHRFGHRGWRRGYRRGYGGGAVLGGLAAGAIIGGAIAASSAANANASYCEQRYRSYDPASGTYLGYDGDRHPCP